MPKEPYLIEIMPAKVKKPAEAKNPASGNPWVVPILGVFFFLALWALIKLTS